MVRRNDRGKYPRLTYRRNLIAGRRRTAINRALALAIRLNRQQHPDRGYQPRAAWRSRRAGAARRRNLY